jgi:hypothetical protein
MRCGVGKTGRRAPLQQLNRFQDEGSRRCSSERSLAERRPWHRAVRWGWLLGIPTALALASPARADTFWAIVSFDGVPPLAVGSADLRIDFDPGVLSPVVTGNPEAPNEIKPLVCTGEPPPAPCDSSAGDTVDLALGNAIAPGQVKVALLSASGVAGAGDVLAVPFRAQNGTVPEASLTVTSITDVMTIPLPAGQQPPIGLRFAVPEPGAVALGSVAIAACLALQRRARRRAALAQR